MFCVSRKDCEIPDSVCQIRLQSPKQQGIAFENDRLLLSRNLCFLLPRVDEKLEAVDVGKRQSSGDLDGSQKQNKSHVDDCGIDQAALC